MEVLEVIKTRDGELHESTKTAVLHCENRLGEEIDDLFKCVPGMGHIMLMNALLPHSARPIQSQSESLMTRASII